MLVSGSLVLVINIKKCKIGEQVYLEMFYASVKLKPTPNFERYHRVVNKEG